MRRTNSGETHNSKGPVLVVKFAVSSVSVLLSCTCSEVSRVFAGDPASLATSRSLEDGPGRLLVGSFRVRIWPNLCVPPRRQVVTQLARPVEDEVEQGLKPSLKLE